MNKQFVVPQVTLVPVHFVSLANMWTIACTNNVPNNSTTTANLGSTVDCSTYEQVGIRIKYALDGSGTTACTFSFNWSADGTNWSTTAPITYSLPPTGATAVATNAIMNLGPIPYLKLSGITAANNSAAMTNISIVVVKKPYPKDY